MKKLLIVAAISVASSAHAGIYRHDVSAESYKKLAREKQFDCVGMVLDDAGQKLIGSCVLIGSRYVLSAAHCFVAADIRVDTFYLDKNGKARKTPFEGATRMLVNQPVNRHPDDISNYSFRFGDRRYYPKRMKINPTYLDSIRLTFGPGDIAVIELVDSVEGITPISLNRQYDELNGIVTGVGYGASGPADRLEDIGPYREKIAGQNVVDKINGYKVNGQPTVLESDMDDPTNKDCNKTGSAEPLPLEWMPGGGDSGGGLFRQVNDRWQLAGIIIGGMSTEQLSKRSYYGGVSEYTRVSCFYNWIQQTIHDFETMK